MKSTSFLITSLKRLGALICLLLIACASFFTGLHKRARPLVPVEHTVQFVAAYNTLPAYTQGKVDDLSNYRQGFASGRSVNDKASI